MGCSASPGAENAWDATGVAGSEPVAPEANAQPEPAPDELSVPVAGTGGSPAVAASGGSPGAADATTPDVGDASPTGGATHLTRCGTKDVDTTTDPAHCGGCERACLVCERRCPTCPWACSVGTCEAGLCRCAEGSALTTASRDPMVFACSSDGYSAASCVEAGFAFCGGYCLQPGELSAHPCQCPVGYHQELVFRGGTNPAGATCVRD